VVWESAACLPAGGKIPKHRLKSNDKSNEYVPLLAKCN